MNEIIILLVFLHNSITKKIVIQLLLENKLYIILEIKSYKIKIYHKYYFDKFKKSMDQRGCRGVSTPPLRLKFGRPAFPIFHQLMVSYPPIESKPYQLCLLLIFCCQIRTLND